MVSPTNFLTYLAVAVAALAPVATANPTPSLTLRDVDSTNPQGVTLRPVDTVYRREPQPRPETNAQRLKRGLGPLPPKRRNARSLLQARQSPVPCSTQTGVIGVTKGADTGYVSAATNSFGEYGFVTDPSLALSVSICESEGVPFEILALNGVTTYPLFGGFKGFYSTSPNLAQGSANYIYIGGTAHTEPHASPAPGGNTFTAATGTQEDIASSFWTFGSNNDLLASWANTDGTHPATQLAYVAIADAFVIVGDLGVFSATLNPATPVTFKFLPASG